MHVTNAIRGTNNVKPNFPASIEAFSPPLLQEFLRDLNKADTPDTVWTLLQELCRDVGQRFVLYSFFYNDPESGPSCLSKSNLPKNWRSWIGAQSDLAKQDYPCRHATDRLTPFATGEEFLDLYRTGGINSPDFERFAHEAAQIGWRSGLVIPLRSTHAAERGRLTLAGDMDETAFRDFLRDHGWTISMAAVQGHLTYMNLLLKAKAAAYELKPRQLEFLRLSAKGLEIKHIAFQWGVSVQYVTRVRRDLCRLLGVTSKMAVMAKSVRLDLLSEEEFEAATKADTTSWT